MNPAWEPAKDSETKTTAWEPLGWYTHKNIRRHTARARESKRDGDTQAPTFTQKIDLCVLLAFRQTNCLSVDNRASEVRMRSHPEIHLFTKNEKDRKKRCGRSRNEKGKSEEDIWTDRVIEIGEPQTERGHVN